MSAPAAAAAIFFLRMAEFKRFLANPPAKGPLPDPQCVGAQRTKCIQRQLVAQGDSV